MVKERRRFIRWNSRIRVTYCLSQDEESYDYKEAFTENICEGGLQISVRKRLEIKQVVRLRLEFMSDSVPIITDGRIIHSRIDQDHYRVGLEFINMDDFQKRRLQHCLELVKKDLKRKAKQRYG